MSYFSKPTTPNGKLYIGNVKWSNDYKNVMLFASAAARDAFLKSHLTLIKSNVIFYNPNGYIDVKRKIENVESINYALYINDSDISDTSYCCFVTNFEYIAPRTTRLYVELDVFQMYHYSTSYYQSFIERAIIDKDDDAMDFNLLPEPINAPLIFEKELTQIGRESNQESDSDVTKKWQPVWVLHSASYYNSLTGEYQYKGLGKQNTFGEYGRFIFNASDLEKLLKMYGRKGFNDTLQDFSDMLDETIGALTQNGKDVLKALIQGIFSGGVATTQGWNNMTGMSTVSDVFNIAEYQDHRDELIGLYAIPRWLYDAYVAAGGEGDDNTGYAVNRRDDVTFPMRINNSSLANGYPPRNKKMLSSVCRGYLLANYTGLSIPFKPELFTGTPSITLYGITMSTSGYQFYISNYSDKQTSHGEVAYASERRVGYDANTGINKALALIGAGAGVASGATQMASGGMGIITGAGAVGQSLVSAIDSLGTKEQHFGNNGDLLRITGARPQLRWYELNPSVSECQAIDNFFDMYGYTIHKHQNPLKYIYTREDGAYNRNKPLRRYWEYIKTENINMKCNAPSDYENKLKAIFNSGVTIWNDYDEFGDYSNTNGNGTEFQS